jgi:outer membrane protein
MKKILILSFTMIMFAPVLWAQTTKGSIALGGGFGINSSKNENAYGNSDYTSSSFQFRPMGGFFVADNLEVGLQVGVTSGKTEYEGFDPTKTSSLSAGPYARYYKFTSNERFAFTGQVGVSFGSGKTTFLDNETKTGSVGVTIAPGFTYFISDKWGLDFQLDLLSFSSYDPNKDVDDNNQTSLSFGFDTFSPSIGFRYYIAK